MSFVTRYLEPALVERLNHLQLSGRSVVEGSITVALVAFGGAQTSTAYAVLLYRIISFWMILVIGWLLIGQLALQVRRGRWPRQALTSGVEAGPGAYDAVVPGATAE